MSQNKPLLLFQTFHHRTVLTWAVRTGKAGWRPEQLGCCGRVQVLEKLACRAVRAEIGESKEHLEVGSRGQRWLQGDVLQKGTIVSVILSSEL